MVFKCMKIRISLILVVVIVMSMGLLRSIIMTNPNKFHNSDNPSLPHPQRRQHAMLLSPPVEGEELINLDSSSFSCSFDPNSSNIDCLNMVSKQFRDIHSYRWLFFGDSTMYRTFHESQLVNRLVVNARTTMETDLCLKKRFQCELKKNYRCRRNMFYNISDVPSEQEWIRPDLTVGEGPVAVGLAHPGCSDCSLCRSALLLCTPNPKLSNSRSLFSSSSPIINNSNITYNLDMDTSKLNMDCDDNISNIPKPRLLHGGYLMMEFARDVEMQSARFHTSQENIHAWLSEVYNAPTLVQAFGKPVCVVAVGLHDMAIPNITLPLFLDNVQWLLKMLHSECVHLIWLANTAPGKVSPTFPQNPTRTLQWNKAVQNLLLQLQQQQPLLFQGRVTFVDVFNSSYNAGHASDQLHMLPQWYADIGELFIKMS